MSEPLEVSSTTRRVNINRLHIHLRGVTPAQARAMVNDLGEEILRQLAESGATPPASSHLQAHQGRPEGTEEETGSFADFSPTQGQKLPGSSFSPPHFGEGAGGGEQSRSTASAASRRVATVNEIRVNAPLTGIAQAVARAVTERTKTER